MNKAEIKAKWLEALRSGDYLQVVGTLKGYRSDGSVGHCCLGVLAENVLGVELETMQYYEPDEILPPDYEGRAEVYSMIKEDIIGNNQKVNAFADKNDNGWTFPEIADYIEREWVVK